MYWNLLLRHIFFTYCGSLYSLIKSTCKYIALSDSARFGDGAAISYKRWVQSRYIDAEQPAAIQLTASFR
ncbi:uncharacterized protein FOMMEDRAFT_23148, partial [Fomitiporia mediterranea MF3/22]|uniref:uncharacterized protein n=1 Tax=Fomitiporia mediterranea (strain MF3/22) TaxID=694068 RepID=UPI000440918B